jgi:hypothetical protein
MNSLTSGNPTMKKGAKFQPGKETALPQAPGKQEFLDGMREAVEEVNLIKAGKKKGKPFQQLLDEL